MHMRMAPVIKVADFIKFLPVNEAPFPACKISSFTIIFFQNGHRASSKGKQLLEKNLIVFEN